MKKRILSLAVMLSLTLALIPATIAADTAPVLAIGFEDGGVNGFVGDGSSTVAVITEQVHSGKRSLKINKPWYDGVYLVIDPYIKPGYAYEFSAWVRSTSEITSLFTLITQLYVGDNMVAEGWIVGKTISAADGWDKFVGVMNYDNQITFDKVIIYINCGPSIDFFVDDVSVKELGPSGLDLSARLPSLHEGYNNFFMLGNLYSCFIFEDKTLNDITAAQVILRHFNTLTNFGAVPDTFTNTKDVYDFDETDKYFSAVTDAGFTSHFHHLTDFPWDYHWVHTNRDGKPLTRAETINNLSNYINEVIPHYSNKVETWVVVNEAFTWNGSSDRGSEIADSWRDAVDKEYPLYKAFANGADVSKGESGADYIEAAFRFARKADPKAKLYYNDGGLDLPNKAAAVAEMVKEINDRWLAEGNNRLLIEGVGMQNHYNVGVQNEIIDLAEFNPTDISNVEKAINLFIDLGVEISITELDINPFGWFENANKYAFPEQDRLERQATLYAQLMQLYKKYSAYIERVTFWGLGDGYTWPDLSYFPGKLFDETFNPKLAYFAVADPEGYLAGNFDTEAKRQAWIQANSLAPNLDTASTWAQEGITGAVQKGFVPADLQSNYTGTITRADFCRMAVRFVEYKTGKSIDAILDEKGLSRDPNAFTDVTNTDILAAYALGMVTGSGGKFNPEGSFNRQQAALMIMNVCKVLGDVADSPTASFADGGSIADWAADGVNFCVANGIMASTGNNNFSPLQAYSRQQSILTFNNIR